MCTGGKTWLCQTLMTGHPRLAHVHRGFMWVCQTLMMQMAGDPRMRTRALVELHMEVTTHAHMWIMQGVTKGLPTWTWKCSLMGGWIITLCKLVLAQTAGVTCKICLKMGGVKIGSGDVSFYQTRFFWQSSRTFFKNLQVSVRQLEQIYILVS